MANGHQAAGNRCHRGGGFELLRQGFAIIVDDGRGRIRRVEIVGKGVDAQFFKLFKFFQALLTQTVFGFLDHGDCLSCYCVSADGR